MSCSIELDDLPDCKNAANMSSANANDLKILIPNLRRKSATKKSVSSISSCNTTTAAAAATSNNAVSSNNSKASVIHSVNISHNNNNNNNNSNVNGKTSGISLSAKLANGKAQSRHLSIVNYGNKLNLSGYVTDSSKKKTHMRDSSISSTTTLNNVLNSITNSHHQHHHHSNINNNNNRDSTKDSNNNNNNSLRQDASNSSNLNVKSLISLKRNLYKKNGNSGSNASTNDLRSSKANLLNDTDSTLPGGGSRKQKFQENNNNNTSSNNNNNNNSLLVHGSSVNERNNSYLLYGDELLSMNMPSTGTVRPKTCCLICCCMVKNCFNAHCSVDAAQAGGVAGATGEAQARLSRMQTLRIILKKMLQKLRNLLKGLLVSLVLCLAFIGMTYLHRRTFNTLKAYESRFDPHNFTLLPSSSSSSATSNDGGLPVSSLNSNQTTTTTTTTTSFAVGINIEFNAAKIELGCNFCYMLVWTATCALMLAYPLYLLVYFLALKRLALRRSRKKQQQQQHIEQQQQQQQQHNIPIITTTSQSTEALGKSSIVTKINAASPSNAVTATTTTTTTIESIKKVVKSKQQAAAATNSAARGASSASGGDSEGADSSINEANMTLNELFRRSLSIFDSPKKLEKLVAYSAAANTNMSTKSSRFRMQKELMYNVGAITAVWILTGYCYLRAIDLLFCSDFIILFSVNFSFSYIVTWTLLHHQFIPLRLLGFILSIAAIIFTIYSDGFLLFNLKFLGNFCAICSAAGSAILKIVWKCTTGNKDNSQRTMLLSLIGVFNFLFAWPIIFVLYFADVETLTVPFYQLLDQGVRTQLVYFMAISSLFGLIYVCVLKFGFLFTDEIFLQIGCILAIPVALVIDTELNDLSLSDLKIGAFMCVLIGSIFLILPDSLYNDCKRMFFPESHEHIETNSLTRRYKYGGAAQSSPVLNPNQIKQNKLSNLSAALNKTG